MAHDTDATASLSPALRFYQDAVTDAAELIEAAEITGVEGELATLRIALRKHMKEHKEDVDLLVKGVRLIAQVVSAQYRMSPARTDEFADAVSAVLRQAGAQLYPGRFG